MLCSKHAIDKGNHAVTGGGITGQMPSGIMDVVDRMLAAQHKSRKPIEVSTNPQLTAAPGISDTPIFAESFELRSDPRLPHEAWVWEQSSDTLIITMGHAMLEDLQLGIKNSLEGRGDYTLGDAPPLWFWWML